MVNVDKEVRELVDSLQLEDEHILQKFEFTNGGKSLSHEEALKFITFLRNELSQKTV